MRTVQKTYLGQSVGFALVLILMSVGIITLMTMALGKSM